MTTRTGTMKQFRCSSTEAVQSGDMSSFSIAISNLSSSRLSSSPFNFLTLSPSLNSTLPSPTTLYSPASLFSTLSHLQAFLYSSLHFPLQLSGPTLISFIFGFLNYRPLINSWPTKGESQCSIHLVDEVT